jgi:hypothetical protein
MTVCATCGNHATWTIEVREPGHDLLTFDSFECAIDRLAPRCAHCGCRVVGHPREADGMLFCCDHCATSRPEPSMADADDEIVDDTIDGSFPASDPPPFWAREPAGGAGR